MQVLTEKIWRLSPPNGLFNETVLANVFPNHSMSARKGLIHRALEQKEILLIKRGLYCLNERNRQTNPHPFSIAHLIHGPSFVSIESALWFHGLIPEALQQVSCTTFKRSREFNTPLGTYFFHRVPCHHFMAGVELIKLNETNWSYIANPVRSIADLIYLRKKIEWKKHGISFLTDSLRIESEDLTALPLKLFDEVIQSFRSRRVKKFLCNLKKEIQ